MLSWQSLDDGSETNPSIPAISVYCGQVPLTTIDGDDFKLTHHVGASSNSQHGRRSKDLPMLLGLGVAWLSAP